MMPTDGYHRRVVVMGRGRGSGSVKGQIWAGAYYGTKIYWVPNLDSIWQCFREGGRFGIRRHGLNSYVKGIIKWRYL